MFEIFGALFGGMFLSGKISSDNRKLKEIRKTFERRAQRRQEWLSSVIDTEYESRLSYYISNPNNAEQVMGEVNKFCEELPSFCNIAYTNDGKFSKNVLRMLMVKQGKLPLSDAIGSIQAPPSYNFQYQIKRKSFDEFMSWIDHELQRNQSYYMPMVYRNLSLCGSQVVTISDIPEGSPGSYECNFD